MIYSRRDLGKLALTGLPASWLLARVSISARAKIDSRIKGVQIGAITYSFRTIPNAEDIVKAYVTMGLGEMELMSNHAEALAGAPSGSGRGGAGRGRGTSTQVSMAKRLAPFADKHKMLVGFHGHANTTDPDEVATPESFATVMAASKYHAANLDIGHYTEAGYDPVAFIQQHHARITNLHLKDKKKATNGGGNTPWGQGDTPIKDVLKLLQKNKWDMPANIEFEYDGDPLVEVPKCLQYCKEALA